MKLLFSKDSDGNVLVHVDDQQFATADYIKMIQEIKNKQQIEVEFSGDITNDEKNSVNKMLQEINQIGKTSPKAKKVIAEDDLEYPKDDINPDDIPF